MQCKYLSSAPQEFIGIMTFGGLEKASKLDSLSHARIDEEVPNEFLQAAKCGFGSIKAKFQCEQTKFIGCYKAGAEVLFSAVGCIYLRVCGFVELIRWVRKPSGENGEMLHREPAKRRMGSRNSSPPSHFSSLSASLVPKWRQYVALLCNGKLNIRCYPCCSTVIEPILQITFAKLVKAQLSDSARYKNPR